MQIEQKNVLMPIRVTACRRGEFQPFYYQTSPFAFIRFFPRSSAQSAS